jgi:hypothetical protein
VFYNAITIKARVYYDIKYEVELPLKEEIISKAEDFDYATYLNKEIVRFSQFEGFINTNLIHTLRKHIENDTKFHWDLFYEHFLQYHFFAKNQQVIYLTYNNDTIFDLNDKENNSLISVRRNSWGDVACYVNFTRLPYVYNENSTILLEDIIFIEMDLNYGYYCGSLCGLWYEIHQYLILSLTLDVLAIYLPHNFGAIS